uniref:Uncharacterized protein n=1 Tax=Arundo donax TaxID=35708 RepID=A0A0A8Y7P2_ARUDO
MALKCKAFQYLGKEHTNSKRTSRKVTSIGVFILLAHISIKPLTLEITSCLQSHLKFKTQVVMDTKPTTLHMLRISPQAPDISHDYAKKH